MKLEFGKRLDRLMRAFEGGARASTREIQALPIEFKTLANTIAPVINKAGLNREAANAVADGWDYLGNMVDDIPKIPELQDKQLDSRLAMITASLKSIAGIVRQTSHESVEIEIPENVLRNFRDSIHILHVCAEYLENKTVDASDLSPNIALFSKAQALSTDFPSVRENKKKAAVLQLAYESIRDQMMPEVIKNLTEKLEHAI